MGPRKGPRGVKGSLARTRLVVQKAGLVGFNWKERKLSSAVYLMPADLCKDLSYYLNVRVADIIGDAKPNGEGWQKLVSWPGRGMFVVVISLEEVPSNSGQ